ncbi:MAG: diacylglycerol kinase family protein [Bacteroidetes bacterium]|nr:diacylglycerol kinase family protein [Bacteroidota bacterium]
MIPRRNLTSFIAAFGFAAKGLAEAIRTQFNIRFHFVATLVAIGMGFYFSISVTEWCFIIFAIAIVWIAELLNTALEYITDFVSPEYNDIAGKVKDIAASAALVAAIASAVIGLIIFIPKMIG